MGKSNSIEKQQKVNEEFNQYIQKMTEDMDKHLNEAKTEIDKMVKRHYEGTTDKMELMEGNYKHLATLSEWSLASIMGIVNACKDALLGGDKKLPEGTLAEDGSKTVPLLGTAAKILADKQAYIVGQVFNIVESVFSSLKSTTQTTVSSQSKAGQVLPGITMFMTVMQNSYRNKQFFNNESIVQNMYVFRVCSSLKEFARISDLNDLELYEDIKTLTRTKINKLNGELMNAIDEGDKVKIQQKQELLTLAKDNLKEYTELIRDLMGTRSLDTSDDEQVESIVSRSVARAKEAIAEYKQSLMQ